MASARRELQREYSRFVKQRDAIPRDTPRAIRRYLQQQRRQSGRIFGRRTMEGFIALMLSPGPGKSVRDMPGPSPMLSNWGFVEDHCDLLARYMKETHGAVLYKIIRRRGNKLREITIDLAYAQKKKRGRFIIEPPID